MKRIFAEPKMEIKSFAAENIVTDSTVTDADPTVNTNAAVKLTFEEIQFKF